MVSCAAVNQATNLRRLVLVLCTAGIILLPCVRAAAPAKKKPPLRPVNINTATLTELQRVPGIGAATAAKIVQMRKSYGTFKSVDDLLAIRGIGRKRLDKMRKYLTVGKAPAPKNSPPGKSANDGKAPPIAPKKGPPAK
jgi:comEA protein